MKPVQAIIMHGHRYVIVGDGKNPQWLANSNYCHNGVWYSYFNERNSQP